MNDEAPAPAPPLLSPADVQLLLENQRELLRYVERRVGDRALAEELVQEAFVRSLDRGDEIRESLLGWLYRVLHNAVIDHQRRRAVAHRGLERFAAELEAQGTEAEALKGVTCACVARLAETLKPEYAEVLRRVELEDTPVKDYAAEVGISANNAGVRLFRARDALRKQVARACGTCAHHGCLDCTCQNRPLAPAQP